MSKKVIVVGGGFGGLTAAAQLAHEGFAVTLLEKNDDLGGRARIWCKDGFRFDMGPSWYLMPEVFDRFFESISRRRSDYYQIQHLDTYYRVFSDTNAPIDITKDKAQHFELFKQLEKNGDKKLKKYLKKAKYKYDTALGEFLYKDYRNIFQFFNAKVIFKGSTLGMFGSLDRFVSSFFKSQLAKHIMEYPMVFLGNSPKNAPAMYSLMSHVDLNLGLWYPDQGIGSIVTALERVLQEENVIIKTGEEVTEIITDQKQVTSVKTTKNSYTADIVLVNADYHHSETTLIKDPQKRTYPQKYWDKKILAPSFLTAYVGINKKLNNIRHHNLYFSGKWDEHFSQIFEQPQWPDNPSYYVSCTSKTEKDCAPPGSEALFFLIPLASGLEDNAQLRELAFNKMLTHFEKIIGENISDHIVLKRLFCINDFQKDYNAFKGTALSLAHTLNQTAIFRPAHKSKKFNNLYYTGHYTHPGVGVPMVFIASDVVSKIIAKDHN